MEIVLQDDVHVGMAARQVESMGHSWTGNLWGKRSELIHIFGWKDQHIGISAGEFPCFITELAHGQISGILFASLKWVA